MRQSHIHIVQSSFARILPMSERVAKMFYNNLFTLDPSLRPLFSGDLNEQGRKLMSALTLVVKGLNDRHQILPALHSLGQRHVRYGVTPEQYATVGLALLLTLEQGFGDEFTPELREAWTAAYEMIASAMIRGGDAAHGGEGTTAAA
ncbi:MAG: globin domain-containing protein [Bacteroidia bacterium]|nr:globin domain-containing protein [Bacteroidia bacterium]